MRTRDEIMEGILEELEDDSEDMQLAYYPAIMEVLLDIRDHVGRVRDMKESQMRAM